MRPVPPPPDEIDFLLLDRFLAGECSPAEAELVRRWLARHEAHADYLGAVRDALPPPTGTFAAPDDPEAGWARLARNTIDAERNADRLPPPLRLTARDPREPSGPLRALATSWLRVAAAIALVAGAVAAGLMVRNSKLLVFSRAGMKAQVREYVAARGERAELRLPDGTQVVLAPDSRLRVPADFATIDRAVMLTGHAYFDVKHDDRKPFRVSAGNTIIYDLGTQFDVRAYPGTQSVQVVVAQGKVRLAAATAPAGTGFVLSQGDVGRVDLAGTVATGRTDLGAAFAWTRGELAFDDVLLGDIAVEWARWYDLDFQIADSLLLQKRLKLRLSTESARGAGAVAMLAGARYQQQGRVVTLIPIPSLWETGR
jgi:transmembrane sensor